MPVAVTLGIPSSNTYVFSTETYPFFPANWRQGGHVSLNEPAKLGTCVDEADELLIATLRRRAKLAITA